MRATAALAAFVALGLAAASCERTPPEMGFLPEDRAAIEAVIEDASELFQAGDWEGASGRFNASAIVLRPGAAPIEERERIRDAIDPGPAHAIIEFDADVDEIEGGPLLAYGRGTYRALVESRDVDVREEHGIWLAVFWKDHDDRWSIHRLMWNPHPRDR